VLVNFKNFAETNGELCLSVAKEIDRAAKESGLLIGVSVQPFFVRELLSETDLLVFGQHLDFSELGSNTGALVPEVLKAVGGVGSLLNHSEKRIPMDQIEKTVARMREVGLKSVVCVESVEEGELVAKFGPDFIAIEPPELIGGDISVSTARPELISDSVARVGSVSVEFPAGADIGLGDVSGVNAQKVLVGAGIKNGQDLKIATELGACGILVASGVCKADNPYEVIMDFAKAIA
jgi:triosephosphate isomerase